MQILTVVTMSVLQTWGMDLWSCAGFHTKHNYRGGYWALAWGRAFGWEWWLSISDQKPHFQDLSLPSHLLLCKYGRNSVVISTGTATSAWRSQKSSCPSSPRSVLGSLSQLSADFAGVTTSAPNEDMVFCSKKNILDCIIPREIILKSMGCCFWQSPWDKQQNADPPSALSSFPLLSFPEEPFPLLWCP